MLLSHQVGIKSLHTTQLYSLLSSEKLEVLINLWPDHHPEEVNDQDASLILYWDEIARDIYQTNDLFL